MALSPLKIVGYGQRVLIFPLYSFDPETADGADTDQNKSVVEQQTINRPFPVCEMFTGAIKVIQYSMLQCQPHPVHGYPFPEGDEL